MANQKALNTMANRERERAVVEWCLSFSNPRHSSNHAEFISKRGIPIENVSVSNEMDFMKNVEPQVIQYVKNILIRLPGVMMDFAITP